MTDSLSSTPHRLERIRHALKFRHVTVRRVSEVTPKMIRVTLTGEELAGFVSGAPDDHVKLFFPRDGETSPTLPTLGPDGRILVDQAAAPIARDYTPRHYDAVANELEIDFAIHEAGPATHWAMQAQPGQTLGIGGPRGSFVVGNDFDWYLMVGDETALPAIGRWLAELPAHARAIVIAEVGSAEEEQAFASRATVRTTWLHRGAQDAGATTLLDEALRAITLPSGDGYAWVACEGGTAKRLREILVGEHRHPKAWLKAAGYWKHGAANVHEVHGE